MQEQSKSTESIEKLIESIGKLATENPSYALAGMTILAGFLTLIFYTYRGHNFSLWGNNASPTGNQRFSNGEVKQDAEIKQGAGKNVNQIVENSKFEGRLTLTQVQDTVGESPSGFYLGQRQ